MKTTAEEVLNHLAPRIKFLEKSYSSAYILISKVLLMKQGELVNSSKMLPVRDAFKALPKPEFSVDDQKEVIEKVFENARSALKEKCEKILNFDSFQIPEVFEVFEKFSNSVLRYSQGRMIEAALPSKPVTRANDKVIKYTAQKITVFQKEARRPSVDRNRSRDMTPKRPPSANLSVSPSDKKIHHVNQENLELKETLKRLTEERDVLKVWKENMLKAPASLSEECNSIIKQQELFIKQLLISNKVLISKLQALVASVLRFLKETSTFQKTTREKEGFSSFDSYETEKSKLKIKLKELAEVKDGQVFVFDFPFFSSNGSFDFSQFTEKYLAVQSENQTLKIHVRDLNKKIRKLECRSPERSFLASPDKSFLASPEKNQESPGKKNEALKNWAQGQVKAMSTYFEKVFEAINRKMNDKENSLGDIRNKFVENLAENFKMLVELKNNVKKSIGQGNPEGVGQHIKELENLIEQNRFYKENEIKELSQAYETLQSQKNSSDENLRLAEKENWELKQKILQFIDLECVLTKAQNTTEDLEGQIVILNKRLREMKQKEMAAEQLVYQKNILELQVNKVKDELMEKEKILEELNQSISLERIKFSAELQQAVLKESTAKKELELISIELNTYKMQISVLENINEDLEKKVKGLS